MTEHLSRAPHALRLGDDDKELLRDLADLAAALPAQSDDELTIHCIGTGEGGARLMAARQGPLTAPVQVLVMAGFHAAELAGVAACLQLLTRDLEHLRGQVCFHILPALDVRNIEANAQAVLSAGEMDALLELRSPRDLEHGFHAACESIPARAWLDSIERLDAFFSLHGAACLSPGAFFYLDCIPELQDELAAPLGRLLESQGLPLATVDPTGISCSAFSRGFFHLTDKGSGAFSYICERFHPSLALITEIPVGFIAGHAHSSAHHLKVVSREHVSEARGGLPTREEIHYLTLQEHVDHLLEIITYVCLVCERPRSLA